METDVRRESAKLDRKQVAQLLKRGPEGFHQDIAEFTGHLKTITDSLDSLLHEYPLLIMSEANVTIEFNMGNDPVCKCILGFTPHDKAEAETEERIKAEEQSMEL